MFFCALQRERASGVVLFGALPLTLGGMEEELEE